MKLSARQLKGLIKEAIGEAGKMYVLLAGRTGEGKLLVGVFSSREKAEAAAKNFSADAESAWRYDGGIKRRVRTKIYPVTVDPTDKESQDSFAEVYGVEYM